MQVLETGGLLNVGTAISPLGRTGAPTAMEATVRYQGGQTVQRAVRTGSVQLVELPTGQKAQVTIKLSRGLTLNGKGRVTLTVDGGVAGLILDGRGRPLIVPKELSRRSELLPKWYAAVRSNM